MEKRQHEANTARIAYLEKEIKNHENRLKFYDETQSMSTENTFESSEDLSRFKNRRLSPRQIIARLDELM